MGGICSPAVTAVQGGKEGGKGGGGFNCGEEPNKERLGKGMWRARRAGHGDTRGRVSTD